MMKRKYRVILLAALVLGWMGKSLLTVAAAACLAAFAAGMLLP